MKDFKEQIAKKRELALYASLTMDFSYVTEVTYSTLDEHYSPLPEGERRERPHEGYVRVTEPVTINFCAVDNDTVVRNAVASLDEEERKLRSELHKKLVELQERKSQLLALTHEIES
jgi:flagellar basal body-associated protein FliL